MPLWQAGRAATRLAPPRTAHLIMLFISSRSGPTAAPAGARSIGAHVVHLDGGLILIIMYYVMIPAADAKRQKEQQRLISSLKTGDRVVTAAGIHGMITNVKDTTVTVKVADNVKIEMEKSAVTQRLEIERGKLK